MTRQGSHPPANRRSQASLPWHKPLPKPPVAGTVAALGAPIPRTAESVVGASCPALHGRPSRSASRKSVLERVASQLWPSRRANMRGGAALGSLGRIFVPRIRFVA
jgi:hypothetical protein